MTLSVFIPGKPVSQGSKRLLNGVLVESSRQLPAWRSDIRNRLIDADGRPLARFGGPVTVALKFVLPRPASTPKRRTPPAIKRPDLDKYAFCLHRPECRNHPEGPAPLGVTP